MCECLCAESLVMHNIQINLFIAAPILMLTSCLDKQVCKLFGKVLIDSLPSWEISSRFAGLSVHYQCSQAWASLRQHIMLLTLSVHGNL